MGIPFSQHVDKETGEKKFDLFKGERSMHEKLECVKAKLYTDALNDECIPIVCAVDKFNDIIFIPKDEMSIDQKNSVKNLIQRHLRMEESSDEELITLVTSVVAILLSQKKGTSEKHTHVVYANRSFIRFDYHIHLDILDDGGGVLFYYGQVGLIELAKARPPVLLYELTRSTGNGYLKKAGKALRKLGDLKIRSVKEVAAFLEERKTYAHEPDLQDLIEYLQTDDTTLIVNAANYLQHLSYSDEQVKVEVRELGGIPVLVRLLDHELEDIHRSAAACLLNLSYSKQRDENKLAIARCYGIEALIRLLKRTRKDEVKEVVLGVLWNLSSCEDLKLRIIEICLIVLVTIIIVPYSGWTKTAAQSNAPIPSIKWSTVLRNASGVLRNVSSAGPEARRVMRDCYGLVDSFVWIIKAPIGKTDIDNKSVENSVCILRNLSYRLENEVDREKFKDAPMIEPSRKEPEKPDPGCMAGCGGASKKTKKGTIKESEQPQIRKDPVEGVELLWQREIVKSYLSIMAESSNPETLEGSTGAVHNLTACGWRWSMVARSAVRKEKGLPILVELLRMNFDPVVRAVATALRNLAIDPRNKDLIGKYATKDLIHRLPDPEARNDRVEENTVGAILCAVHQVVNKSIPNAKHVRSVGGLKKIVAIAKTRDRYSPKIVKTANQVLITIWNLVPLRSSLKNEGWEFTKEIGDEFGHVRPTPRPFEDIMPRGRQPPPGSLKREPRPIRAEETSIPQPQFYDPVKSRPEPSTSTKGDGYEGDDEIRRRRAPREVRDEMAMEDIGGYRELDNNPDPEPIGGAQALPPAYDSRQPREEPMYAQVDKSKKKMYKLQGNEGPQTDSWV